MRVRIQKGGIMQEPIMVDEADGVVVCTDEGTPVAVAKDMEGKAFVSVAGDKTFALMLQSLGYRKDEVPEVVTAGG